MKEFTVEIPEGYEIDKEKSTFEKIVFKIKEEVINCWEDIKQITGRFTHAQTDNKNVFLNEKYAKAALAFAQICQLLPYYDSKVDWNGSIEKYCICRHKDTIGIDRWESFYHPIAFNTWEEADRFLKYNEQLVKDYYMMD